MFTITEIEKILGEHLAMLYERLEERLKDSPTEDHPFTEEQRKAIMMQFTGVNTDLFIEFNLHDLLQNSKNRR